MMKQTDDAIATVLVIWVREDRCYNVTDNAGRFAEVDYKYANSRDRAIAEGHARADAYARLRAYQDIGAELYWQE